MFGSFLPELERAQARYSADQLIGNGLEKLGYISESKLTTRSFRNRLKSCGIYRPCYVDKAVLQFGRTQMRYDPRVSNKSFKYSFFQQGGTLAELRTFPKRPFKPVTGYRDQSRRGRLTRAHKTLPGAVAWKPDRRVRRTASAAVELGGNGPSEPATNPVAPTAKWVSKRVLSRRTTSSLVRVARRGANDAFVSILGGVTFAFPPSAEHKKYEYFYRTRGSWTFSLHHPYGDEYEVYRCLNMPGFDLGKIPQTEES